MNELLEIMVGQGFLGQAIKHFLPWDRLNKFIPIINMIGGVAYAKTRGLDWGSAATVGIVGQLGTGNVKGWAKSKLSGRQFPGLGILDKRVTFVKRSF